MIHENDNSTAGLSQHRLQQLEEEVHELREEISKYNDRLKEVEIVIRGVSGLNGIANRTARLESDTAEIKEMLRSLRYFIITLAIISIALGGGGNLLLKLMQLLNIL